MKHCIWLLALMLLASPARSQQQGQGGKQGQPGELTPTHKAEALNKAFSHAGSCPKGCKTCQTALKKAWAYLAKVQQASGAWEAGNGGTVVITCIAGLALMAGGEKQYEGNVDKAADFVLRTLAPGHTGGGKTASGQEFAGFGNWDLGYGAIFLGEYYAGHPRPAIEEKAKFIIDKIKEQREPNGGWGHAPNFAYKDLMVVTTCCLAGLGTLKAAGFKIPENVVADGVKWIQDSSSGGTVGYSPRPGQKGWGYAGRASGAAYAMWRCGVSGNFFDQVVRFVRSGIKTVHLDHASPTLHYLWGGIYSYVLGPDCWVEYKRNYLDLWLAMQKEDGSVPCPTDADVKGALGLDTDGLVGVNYPTAVFALVFALPLDKTHLNKQKMSKGKGSGMTATQGLGISAPKKAEGKPYLGLRGRNSTESVEVVKLVDKGPSDGSGILSGDLLVEFKGKKIAKTTDLRAALDACSPGQKVGLVVLRRGEKKLIEIKLGELPKGKPKEANDVATPDSKSDNSTEEGELF